MSLQRQDFAAFFAAAHGRPDWRPFAWQERLLDRVLTGRWPEQVVAPTATGKTSVIDVHVFAVALHAAVGAPRVPRRLSLVVDRRSLVDDQFAHALALRDLLGPGAVGVLGQVRAALVGLRWSDDPLHPPGADSPLVVGRLRGGMRPSRGWLDDPTACAVLSATPDMWGSRLLLGGYGSSPRAWPREAGLLAYDSVVVVDEAHLARQLLATARRVPQLEATATRTLASPGLQVVQTTATPDITGADAVGVHPDDLAGDPVLARRVATSKPVTLLPVPTWPIKDAFRAPGRATAQVLADTVCRLREEQGPTVVCFANTVRTAIAVGELLRGRTRPDGTPLTVVTLCGRMRRHDREQLQSRHPGLLTPAGDPAVDVVVATQTLEVGVDADFRAAVSELAPAGSLTQRAGRVNRLGHRERTGFVVLVPEADIPDTAPSQPYLPADLREALVWLDRRQADPAGLAVTALFDDPPPAPQPRRPLLSRPELAEALHWARTSDDLAAAPDMVLWLDDDLEPDLDVGVVVRDHMPADPQDALRLVRAVPVRDEEVFPATVTTGRDLLTRLTTESRDGAHPCVALLRGDDVIPVPQDGNDAPDLRPGDLLVVDSGVPLVREDVLTPGTDNARPARDVSGAGTARGTLLLRLEAGLPGTPWSPVLVNDVLVEAQELLEGGATNSARRSLATLLTSHLATAGRSTSSDRLLVGVAGLLRGRVGDCAVTLHTDPDGIPLRLVVRDTRRMVRDEELRQILTPAAGPVTLEAHSRAVAARARRIAEQLGEEHSATTVELVGLLHDTGKTDPRFQQLLGAQPDGPLLAKSGRVAVTGATTGAGLPAGWRHEQLSAVYAAMATGQSTLSPHPGPDGPVGRGPAAADADVALTVRLVGTSHGRGRASFPHNASELTTGHNEDQVQAVAADLFDTGTWDEIVEATHLTWGVWGCAYLEALLRAADGQVSAEGS